jgi:hypothetical protein
MEIKELIIYSNRLDEQQKFYTEILGLDQINSASKNEISYLIRNSILKFIKKEGTTPYHFAINIFSNKEKEAFAWLKQRTAILKIGGNEIQNFASWNSKAIYFYDEDKNIVEFIARKNFNIESNETFSTNSLLEISEIGLPVDDIENIYNKINSKIGLPIYSGDFDEFCAIGDEKGLFICFDQNKKGWFPVNDKGFPSEFKAKIINENKIFELEYSQGELKIISIAA